MIDEFFLCHPTDIIPSTDCANEKKIDKDDLKN